MLSDQKRPCLFLFAHPDDEFAVFPWLRRFAQEGRVVRCVWLTDGGWGGQDTERRRNESIHVLSALGLKPDDMRFLGEELGVPDGSLYRKLDAVLPELDRWASVAGHAPLVFAPAWEGGHVDHDATHLAAHALTRTYQGDLYQFSLYHGYERSGPWFQVLSPLPFNGPRQAIDVSGIERIGHVFRCLGFRSQWKSFLGLLPFYAMRMMSREAFSVQAGDWGRTAERPHPGALLYERRGGPQWLDFAEETAALRCSRF